MTMTDIKEKLVDCNIAIVLALVGIFYNYFINNSLFDSLLGLLAGIIVMEILARIGFIFVKNRAVLPQKGQGFNFVLFCSIVALRHFFD